MGFPNGAPIVQSGVRPDQDPFIGSRRMKVAPKWFWRNHEHRFNMKTMKRSYAFCTLGLALGLLSPLVCPAAVSTPIQEGEMAGYLLVPNVKVPTTYNAGFSLYVAAWPLLQEYPDISFRVACGYLDVCPV